MEKQLLGQPPTPMPPKLAGLQPSVVERTARRRRRMAGILGWEQSKDDCLTGL